MKSYKERYQQDVAQMLSYIKAQNSERIIFPGDSAATLAKDLKKMAKAQKVTLPQVFVVTDGSGYSLDVLKETANQTMPPGTSALICDDYAILAQKLVRLKTFLESSGRQGTVRSVLLATALPLSEEYAHIIDNKPDQGFVKYIHFRNKHINSMQALLGKIE